MAKTLALMTWVFALTLTATPGYAQTQPKKGICGYVQSFPGSTLNKAYFTDVFDADVPVSLMAANGFRNRQQESFKSHVNDTYGEGPQGFSLYCRYYNTASEAQRELARDKNSERGTAILRSEIIPTQFVP